MPKKILGLELLRGLCALLVAVFHCLMLSGIAHFPRWGLYSVYIFFAISGAVLYQNYHAVLSLTPKAGEISIPDFMMKRFARLAPLYVAAVLAPGIIRQVWIPDQYFLNASLLFGFVSPGKTESVTGGWSLGIEFVLYALFPTLITFTRELKTMLLALLGFLLLRMVFIEYLLQGTTLDEMWAVYTQVGTFLIFFFGGMTVARLMANLSINPLILAAGGILCMAALLLPPNAPQESVIMGWRGTLYTVLSIITVAGFFWSPTFSWGISISRFLGEISYGVYLLHPIILFSSIKHLPSMNPVPRVVLTLSSSIALAWLLRFYERPVRSIILRAFQTRSTLSAHG